MHLLYNETQCHCVCTGKTVTLVEAIIQIEKKETNSHILACASHNKDADLICQELVKNVPKSKVLRMYAKSVDANLVPKDLKVSVSFFSFKQIVLKHYSIINLYFRFESTIVKNQTYCDVTKGTAYS